MAEVIEQANEDLHLAEEHGLVPVRAYIKDENRAAKKSANAERQARFAEKQRSAGLTKAFIPIEVAEAIKNTPGGLVEWVAQQRSEAVAAAAVPAAAPTPRQAAPDPLTPEQTRLMALGRQVDALEGWRRSLVRWLIR